MFPTQLAEAVLRDRHRGLEQRRRAEYVRRVVVARRRQRRADAAHRALAAMVVR